MVPFGILLIPNDRSLPFLAGKRDSAIRVNEFFLHRSKMKDFLHTLKVPGVHYGSKEILLTLFYKSPYCQLGKEKREKERGGRERREAVFSLGKRR